MNKFKHILLLFTLLLAVACQDNNYDNNNYENEDEKMLTYLENNDNFTDFVSIIHKSGLYDLLSLAGDYTFFTPNNEALADYYTQKGITGADDLSAEQCNTLVKSHLINERILSNDFVSGTLGERNLNDNYVLVKYDDENQEGPVSINGANSVNLDIEKLNGVIHEMGDVIEPYENTLLETLQDGNYSIFLEALDSTGYIDSLKLDHFDGENHLTVLAIKDDVYQRIGINNFSELKDSMATGADLSDPENKLNISMGNCLICNFYSTNDFYDNGSRYYSSLSMYPTLTVIDDGYVWLNPIQIIDDYYKGTSYIDLEESNIMAKNGITHNISDILTPIEIVREEQTFYFSSVDSATNLISTSGKDFVYRNDYLVYGSNEDAEIGDYFEVKGPILLSGRYDIYATNPSWAAGTILMGVSINGEQVGNSFVDTEGEKYLGEIEITQTTSISIKVELTSLYTDATENKMRISNLRIVPID